MEHACRICGCVSAMCRKQWDGYHYCVACLDEIAPGLDDYVKAHSSYEEMCIAQTQSWPKIRLFVLSTIGLTTLTLMASLGIDLIPQAQLTYFIVGEIALAGILFLTLNPLWTVLSGNLSTNVIIKDGTVCLRLVPHAGNAVTHRLPLEMITSWNDAPDQCTGKREITISYDMPLTARMFYPRGKTLALGHDDEHYYALKAFLTLSSGVKRVNPRR